MNPKGAPRSEQPDMNGSAPNVHRWSASYPAGVAQTVNTDALVSLKELVEEAFRSEGAKVALIQMGRRFTFAELDRYSLSSPPGSKAKVCEKVIGSQLCCRTCWQYGVVLCAAFRVGAVVVNINPLFTAREVQLQLEDSGATVLVALANVLEAVAPVLARTAVRRVCVTEVGDLLGGFKRLVVNRVARRGAGKRFAVIPCAIAWAEAVRRGSAETYVEVLVAGADLSFLQYTGGTTAAPKAAALTHANLCANILQSQAWVKGALRPSGLAVTALPLYHIFALEGNFLLFMRLGWSNLLIVNARDVRGFVKELGKYRPGFISGVNTLFRALLSTPGFTELHFSDLQIALTGGMDTSPHDCGGVVEGHRSRAHAGLGPHGVFSRCVHQSARCGLQRVCRRSDAFDGSACNWGGRRRGSCGANRRVVCERTAGDEWLLEAGGTDSTGLHGRRVASNRGSGPYGRTRIRLHCGSVE